MKERWIHSIEVGFLIALLLTPRFAWAQSEEARAKQLFKEGQTAYDLAEFDKALELYSEAYRLKPLPGFLFNMAQCHRQKGNYERAAFFFQRFIDNSAPKAPNLDIAKELLAEMRAKQAEKVEKAVAEPKKAETKSTEPTGFAELKTPTTEPAPKPPPTVKPGTSPSPGTNPNPSPVNGPDKPKPDAPVAAAPKSLEPTMSSTGSELTQEQPFERPVYEKGWFWAVVGVGAAAIAGGIVTAMVLTRPQPRTPSLGEIGSHQ